MEYCELLADSKGAEALFFFFVGSRVPATSVFGLKLRVYEAVSRGSGAFCLLFFSGQLCFFFRRLPRPSY
jgi:hypothetical protein